jgi:inorganic pyrophosphatase
MSKRPNRLTELETYNKNSGDLTVIVETPKNSRSKYAYDELSGAFDLKFVLPNDMTFPVDFGFIPSTLGGDGDPLDAIVLLDEGLAVGTKIRARLLGAILAEEQSAGEDWERNDRLIVAATHAHTYERARSVSDLNPHMLETIESFFERYNKLHAKGFRVTGRVDGDEARKLVKKGMKDYGKNRD